MGKSIYFAANSARIVAMTLRALLASECNPQYMADIGRSTSSPVEDDTIVFVRVSIAMRERVLAQSLDGRVVPRNLIASHDGPSSDEGR